ncbi:MAG: hypothetical protein IK990_04060 [Ruminiclostridium sp.]|nr:hypothetical protein [Ruminiclostridium sp.]
MEKYSELIDRISAFEKKELFLGNGDFTVNPSVAAKVGEDNRFGSFYGDTIVFRLDKRDIRDIGMFINELYAQNGRCFCERFPDDTLHMTLHDLSNSPHYDDIADKMTENERRLWTITRDAIIPAPVKMRCKAIFNMVNTSLVLGLYPDSEEDHRQLMLLYEAVDTICPLPYPFTPHITLAYFNRYGFDAESARSLEHTVNQLNFSPAFEKLSLHGIMLDPDKLYYQHFMSMKDYTDVFRL